MAHFRTKGILNHDKIIFVSGCFTACRYANNLLLKDVAYGVVDSSIFINWKSPFPILGVSGVLFYFDIIFDGNSC